MRIKNTPTFHMKAGPDDGLKDGEFIVYPSTFTKTPDSYGDVVAPGAFLKSIDNWKASGNVLPGLFGHRMDDPDFYIASAIDMGEDEHGWWVKGMFDLDSPKGLQVYRLVKGRRLNQLSFAYDVVEEKADVEMPGGVKANELRELTVHEFSFVPVGANQDTSVVAVKALTDQVVSDIESGRVLSPENEDALRSAITAVLDALNGTEEDPGTDAGTEDVGKPANGEGAPSQVADMQSRSASPRPPAIVAMEMLSLEMDMSA